MQEVKADKLTMKMILQASVLHVFIHQKPEKEKGHVFKLFSIWLIT